MEALTQNKLTHRQRMAQQMYVDIRIEKNNCKFDCGIYTRQHVADHIQHLSRDPDFDTTGTVAHLDGNYTIRFRNISRNKIYVGRTWLKPTQIGRIKIGYPAN